MLKKQIIMKKTNLIFIAFILVNLTGFAQITGGGGTGNGAEKEQAAEKGPWKHRFNLNIGFNKPMGIWGQEPLNTSTLSGVYLQKSGIGANGGFSFELGNTFFLKKIEIMDDKLKFGINTAYIDFSFNPIKSSWENKGGVYTNGKFSPFYFFGLKVGALASYNLIEDKIWADLYIDYNPTVSIGPQMESGYDSDDDYRYSFTTDAYGFGNRFTIGANFRALVFSVGAEFVLGHMNYNTTVNITDKNAPSSSLYGVTTTDEFVTKFNTNTLRLKVGFSF